MNTARRIAKNTSVLFSSQIISYILVFFATMYTARYLGAEGFGILSLALALTGIFGVFADLGLSNLTVREVARDKSLANKYLGNIAVIKIILAFLTFGIMALVVNILGYPQQVSYVIYIITLSSLFASFSGLFYSIFQAYEKMEYQSVSTILNGILMFLGVIITIYYGLSIITFAYIYIIVNGICLIYCVFVCISKFFLPKLEINWIFWKPLIIEALPLSVALLFSVIGFRIDSVLLSIMKGNIAVGLYTAPYRLMEALMVIPSIFTVAIYPVMSNFYISSRESLIKSYKKSFKYLIILGLPIAVGTTLLADRLILLIYGVEFVQSVVVLQILIWEIPIVFLTYFFGTLFVSINKQKLLLKILFIC
ncbi:MAG: flippase, partial [Methanobacterium paludis]|nr:flippase [Methanobacterium paludis]